MARGAGSPPEAHHQHRVHSKLRPTTAAFTAAAGSASLQVAQMI